MGRERKTLFRHGYLVTKMYEDGTVTVDDGYTGECLFSLPPERANELAVAISSAVFPHLPTGRKL